MLIASRRQIERTDLGRGYVEGWSTEEFATYVRSRSHQGEVLLCRDHGGPWQHPSEHNRTETEALTSAADSLKADIAAGFNVIHIDTSEDGNGPASPESASRRLVELYGSAWEHASVAGRVVEFEIGFESQTKTVGDPIEFAEKLDDVLDRLKAHQLPRPKFTVAQTGTKVSESGNVGDLASPSQQEEGFSVVRKLADVCRRRGVLLKAHNVDYLQAEEHRRLIDNGVDAINVAPEFGVVETRTLLESMRAFGHGESADEIVEIADRSGRWSSWTAQPELLGASGRAELAGHYVFANPRVRQLRAAFDADLQQRGVPDPCSERLKILVDDYASSTYVVRDVLSWSRGATMSQAERTV
jgi:hypothetical protein